MSSGMNVKQDKKTRTLTSQQNSVEKRINNMKRMEIKNINNYKVYKSYLSSRILSIADESCFRLPSNHLLTADLSQVPLTIA